MKPLTERQVLVVDDSKTIRVVMKDFLKNAGFANILEAEDGEQAIRIFRRVRPEIVFLDLQIPKIDGQEVAKQILDMNPHSTVIIVSAEDVNDVRKNLLRIGVYDYLKKPVKFEELANLTERMRKELSGQRGKKLQHASVLASGSTLVEYSPTIEPTHFRNLFRDLRARYDKVHLFTSPSSLLLGTFANDRKVDLHMLTTSDGADQKWRRKGETVSIRDPSRVADDISSALEDAGTRRTLLLFDGLTDSIVQVGFETTYSLLKEILSLLRAHKVTALFFLNVQAHDDRQIAAIRGAVPNRMDLLKGKVDGS